ADAIDARDEHGLFEFFSVERKQTTKPADFAQNFATMGRGEKLRERRFDLVTEINIDTSGSVSFLFHAARMKGQGGFHAKHFVLERSFKITFFLKNTPRLQEQIFNRVDAIL